MPCFLLAHVCPLLDRIDRKFFPILSWTLSPRNLSSQAPRLPSGWASSFFLSYGGISLYVSRRESRQNSYFWPAFLTSPLSDLGHALTDLKISLSSLLESLSTAISALAHPSTQLRGHSLRRLPTSTSRRAPPCLRSHGNLQVHLWLRILCDLPGLLLYSWVRWRASLRQESPELSQQCPYSSCWINMYWAQ